MAGLRCPFCRCFTSAAPVRELEIHEKDRLWSHHALLTCQACVKNFVAKYDGAIWSAVYPIMHEPIAEEVPQPIQSQFKEAHLCFAVGAYTGCLLVCRTALTALQRQQSVSSLRELKEKGTISSMLYAQADQVRLWANVVAHEDITPEDITKEDTEQLLTYLEAILDAVYVQPKRLSAMTEKLSQLKGDSKE